MSAEIETAAFSNTPAWHGAGTVVQGFMSTRQAFVQSGLDWENGVEKRPLFTSSRQFDSNSQPMDALDKTPAELGASRLIDPLQVADRWAVVRNQDNSILGVVGPDYQVIQNVEMFNFLDTLTTGEDRTAQWESAGSLRGGRQVWALLNLVQSDIMVGRNDRVLPYLLVTNAHDGSAACRVIPTTVRVVCWNTLSAAVAGQFRDLTVTIRHTGDTEHKLEQAKLMIARAGEMFGAFGKVANELAEKEVSRSALEELVNDLFPAPAEDASKTLQTRIERQRDGFAQSLSEEVKLLPAAGSAYQPMTYWTLLNGVTRYADHGREVRPGKRPVAEARFESNMIGSNAAFKRRAVDRVIELAELSVN